MLAEAIYPTTSILAGCGFSIPFTRILLRGDVEEIVVAHVEVDHSVCVCVCVCVCVDDVGESSIGMIRALFRQLRDAAICLGLMEKAQASYLGQDYHCYFIRGSILSSPAFLSDC